MANDPQENVDVTAGHELSEEMLSGVSGGDGPGSVGLCQVRGRESGFPHTNCRL
jgi:hypothetical protein